MINNSADDVINVTYQTNGRSVKNDALGMREMQRRVYEARAHQYLLVKAPPASGKSRALMFVALDKMNVQGLKKTIVAVPERSIGKSFQSTKLKDFGFYWNWEVEEQYDLCTPGGYESKVKTLGQFLDDPSAKVLVCTHATLRFAFDELGAQKFNNCFIGIDEFHHVSADYESRLGELVRSLMSDSNAHIMAMTGSYFRGDGKPVLMPDDEAKFYNVTYNYYEQLNGYQYLKSLGIGFHFYSGKYGTAISDVLDSKKKTIVYIPNVNSGESTKDKYLEVDTILDKIGTIEKRDPKTNILF
jgi:superfamily II DNA or RNA helicase